MAARLRLVTTSSPTLAEQPRNTMETMCSMVSMPKGEGHADEIPQSIMEDEVNNATMEQVIRDLAATVINSVTNRRDHPSYGVTKTKIAAERERMEGAIGMYMVIN